MSLSDAKSISRCPDTLPGYMSSSGITASIGGELVTFYCDHPDRGQCKSLNTGSLTICYASKDQELCFNATGGGTKWNATAKVCNCTDDTKEFDKAQGKCVKKTSATRDECTARGCAWDGTKCWADPGYNQWMDNTGHCYPTTVCPEGYTCNPGQVINVDNSNHFGDVGSNNPVSVNTEQTNNNNQTSQNQNANSNSNSNENHNGSDNGNTTVVGDGNVVNSNNGGGYQGPSQSVLNCLKDPRRQGKEELLACCYLSATARSGGNPDFNTGKCVCNDPARTFSIRSDGRGQCTGGGQGGGGGGHGGGNGAPCPDRMYRDVNGTCQCEQENQTPINNNTACKCSVPNATNDANGVCQCNEAGKIIVDGQCVFPVKNCPDGMRYNPGNGQCECNDPVTQRKNGDKCECIAVGTVMENGFCKCTNKEMVLKDNKCVYDETAIESIRGKITASFGRLNSTMGGFEKSVWKDAEGNFNTARLASDSIAGVVLGTAGGIITSKLVKKNQLKKGFEDIKCSIGGQNVASYGDSFSVGM